MEKELKFDKSPIVWWKSPSMRIVKVKFKNELDYRYVFEEMKIDMLNNESWIYLGEIKYISNHDEFNNHLHTFFEILDREGFQKHETIEMID